MSALHVDLLRHGDTGQQSYRGQIDDSLSELGWRQLREATRGGNWDWVVSSSLRRCADFASWFARERRLPCRIDKRLVEYHFGAWQGRRIDDIESSEPDALARYYTNPARHAPPRAEDFCAFGARLVDAIDEIVATSTQQRVLVVTHGKVIRWLRCRLESRGFGEMVSIDVPHGSIHRLSIK